MRQRLEYAAAWPFITLLGILPRPLARAFAAVLGRTVYLLHGRLRRVGTRNLALAFPEKSAAERKRILRGEFASLGRQLVEVCRFPKYTLENLSEIIVFEDFQNFERARARGKGVLLFAGHFGGWELSSFAISMRGHWMHVLMRGMDNPYLGRLILHYRTMHGNKAVDKDDFVRGLLSAMRANEVVGMLIDTNMTPPQGIFVDFFSIPACTASGLARIALKTDAAVVPDVHHLGCGTGQVPLALRSRAGVGPQRRSRSRHQIQHAEVHQSHRGLCEKVSRPVAVGAPPLEDAAGGGEGAVLTKSTRKTRKLEN